MGMTNGIVPTSPSLPAGAKPTGQVVQIVSLPEGLQNNARAIRLEGEVVAQNQDGSTRIKTSEGTIDISFRGKQPQPGTKLEVDIPVGAPPRSATVRPAPPTPQTPAPVDTDSFTPTSPRVLPQQQTPTTQPPTPQTQQASGQGTQQSQQAGTAQQPLPPSYQAPPKSISAQTTPQPLTQGQSVRLTTLPPVQAQAYISQSLAQLSQNAATSTLARAAFKADIVAANASETLLKTAAPDVGNITTPKQAASGVSTTPTGTTPSAAGAQNTLHAISPAHLFETSLLPSTVLDQKISLPLASVLRIDSETNTIKNLLSSLGIFTKSNSAPQPPVTQQSFITSALPSPKLLQLDIKIMDVKSPQAILSAPQSQAVLPSPQAPPSLANVAPTAITGVVTGFTPQNLPILNVQWPSGTLSQNLILQFPADNVDVGTHILFQAQSSSAFTAGTALKPALNIPLMEASSFWPVMDDMFQSLSQSSSPMAQMLARVLPSPANPSGIGAAALLFIASVRAGDISGWLGDKKIEALTKSGKETLVKRLMQDAGNAVQSNTDSSTPEWRSYPIPMLWQNEISKVMLHIKHDREADGKDGKEGSTRFIMDLSLNRMGEVQLDGLLRGKRLDLLVRTQMPISLSMQDAMKKAYADALQGTDIFGELGFQGDIKGWMNVLKREDKLVLSS